jgi:IS4 transposase
MDVYKSKSAYYEFIDNPNYNWRKMLTQVSKDFVRQRAVDEGGYSTLLIDDTPKEKYGKKVEYISRFKNHLKGVTCTGYEVPFLAWTNGRSCIPLDFELKIGSKLCTHAKIGEYEAGSHTHDRIQDASLFKTEILIDFLKRALINGIPFDFVSWDSWYNCSQIYKYVYEKLVPQNIHLVTMIKQGRETYTYEKEKLTTKQLYVKAGEWKEMKIEKETDGGKTKLIKIKYKSLIIDLHDKTHKSNQPFIGKAKIYFIQLPNHQRTNEYRILLTTDLDMPIEKIIKIYSQRWQIEVMFRDLKQHLGFNQAKLSKYSAQIGDLTIRCIFYIMLCSCKDRAPTTKRQPTLFEICGDFERHWVQMLILCFGELMTMRVLRSLFRDDIEEDVKLIMDKAQIIFNEMYKPPIKKNEFVLGKESECKQFDELLFNLVIEKENI